MEIVCENLEKVRDAIVVMAMLCRNRKAWCCAEIGLAGFMPVAIDFGYTDSGFVNAEADGILLCRWDHDFNDMAGLNASLLYHSGLFTKEA